MSADQLTAEGLQITVPDGVELLVKTKGCTGTTELKQDNAFNPDVKSWELMLHADRMPTPRPTPQPPQGTCEDEWWALQNPYECGYPEDYDYGDY